MSAGPAPLLRRMLVALPDAVTAGFFFTVWLQPLRWGSQAVATAMLVMLIEFITVHANGMFGGFALDNELPRGMRTLLTLVLSLFYLIFVFAFVAIFDQWWPLLAFAWLLLGKWSSVLLNRRVDRNAAATMMRDWVSAGVLYVLGVMATVMLPVPRLGITQSLHPMFELSGEGLWVDEPHRVVAFGALYFLALAIIKFRTATR